jgi:16S rRNA (adenine1518-N6/adenine1519-N6)-dimethyltransferase
MSVKAKKHLGQHFLVDKGVSKRIADQFGRHRGCSKVLEIGPGMGALTDYLLEQTENELWLMDIDDESIVYLNEHYPSLKGKIIHADFLKTNLATFFGSEPFAVVGNFPYNISSQILFRCLEYRNQIPEIMGMFQKEVAERIAEKPGSKTYGIISVLLQAFYDIKYCFTVDENVFNPPPKVKSGVIRLTRNERDTLPCNEKFFIQIVKSCFNQRRKMIRNSVKPFLNGSTEIHRFFETRPEQLSVEDFIELTLFLETLKIEG